MKSVSKRQEKMPACFVNCKKNIFFKLSLKEVILDPTVEETLLSIRNFTDKLIKQIISEPQESLELQLSTVIKIKGNYFIYYPLGIREKLKDC